MYKYLHVYQIDNSFLPLKSQPVQHWSRNPWTLFEPDEERL